MASKGPKADAAAPAAKPRAKATPAKAKAEPAAASPVAVKAAPAAKPASARKPVPAKTEVLSAPKPDAVAVKAPAPEPVAATPPEPVAAPEPVAVTAPPEPKAAPAPVAAEPVVAAPAVPAAPKIKTTSTPAAKKEYFAMTSVETMTEKSQAMIAEMNERAKTAMEKSAKIVEEMNDFAKGNVEAIVESGRITAKGLETLGQDAAEFSRKSFESATAALKSLSSVKSPAEFMKLHSDFTRQLFDSYVAETSKTTEAVLKLAGDAAQPISNRVAVATEKMKTAA